MSTEETSSCTTVTQINRKVTTSVFHKIKTKNNSNFNKSNKFDHGCEINLDWNSQNHRQKHVNGQRHQKSKVQHNKYISNNRMNHSNEKNLLYENDNIYKKPKEPEKVIYTLYTFILYLINFINFNNYFFKSYILRLLSQRENMSCFIQLMVHYIIFKCNLKIDSKKDMNGVFSGINQAMVIGIN